MEKIDKYGNKYISMVISISWFITKNILSNVYSNISKKRVNPSEIFLFVIFIIAIFFTILELEVQNINYESQTILDNVKKSPYMALYAKGTFFIGNQFKEEESMDVNFWKNLKVCKVPQLVKLMPHQKCAYVFRKVIPFEEIFLTIQRSDKQHLIKYEAAGMSIYFDGPYRDIELISKIQKETHINKNIIDLVNCFPIIIVNKEALKDKYKFNPEHPPFCLYVRYFSKKAEIPLRIIVADRLPYNYSYVISYKEYQKIKSGYYYKKIDNFNIILTDEDNLKIVKDLINQIFSKKVKEITLFIKGKKPVLNIKLCKEENRLSLLKQFFFNHKIVHDLLKVIKAVELGPSVEEEILSFNRLILYPNFAFLKKEYIFAIYDFLAKNGIVVEGDLLYSLTNAQELRSKFESLNRSLKYGVVWITIVIALSFWIFLYTQIYTIGIYRMYGISNLEIILSYIFVYFICVLIGVLIGICLDESYHWFRYKKVPLLFELQNMFFSWNVIKSLILSMVIPLVGIIFALLFFLISKTPADMISYKG